MERCYNCTSRSVYYGVLLQVNQYISPNEALPAYSASDSCDKTVGFSAAFEGALLTFQMCGTFPRPSNHNRLSDIAVKNRC